MAVSDAEIKVGDYVRARAGAYKGKVGTVLRVVSTRDEELSSDKALVSFPRAGQTTSTRTRWRRRRRSKGEPAAVREARPDARRDTWPRPPPGFQPLPLERLHLVEIHEGAPLNLDRAETAAVDEVVNRRPRHAAHLRRLGLADEATVRQLLLLLASRRH